MAADLRGIESHGIARLRHFYVDRIERGAIDPVARPAIVRETPTSLAFDARNGLGHPPVEARDGADDRQSARERHCVHDRAQFEPLRDRRLLRDDGARARPDRDRSTDSIHYGAPTFGSRKKFGTNPFAFAIPAGDEPPFVLDFATTAVTFGKLEVYARMGKPLLPGWAVDVHGAPTDDPAQASPAGALLPLGGFGTAAADTRASASVCMCEILCGVLAGAAFGPELSISDATSGGGHVGHFFGALRIDALRDLAAFKADMDRELRAFRTSAPAAGHDRVRVAGDPERENEIVNRREGVPHLPKVWEVVDGLAAELGIHADAALLDRGFPRRAAGERDGTWHSPAPDTKRCDNLACLCEVPFTQATCSEFCASPDGRDPATFAARAATRVAGSKSKRSSTAGSARNPCNLRSVTAIDPRTPLVLEPKLTTRDLGRRRVGATLRQNTAMPRRRSASRGNAGTTTASLPAACPARRWARRARVSAPR